MHQLGGHTNVIICQKSKVDDWINHIRDHYPDMQAWDGTKADQLKKFLTTPHHHAHVLIINYELVFRRPNLKDLWIDTLMLDESSLITNEQAKRSKFIMGLTYKNLILLSGTPTNGKYELLWSQLHMLGWNISKELYWKQYVDVEYQNDQGFPIKIVRGYKNVDRLKAKMTEYGCRFLKTEEVMDLPEQTDQYIYIPPTKEYKKFINTRIINIDGVDLVGDTTLTKILYERQLCGQYNRDKLRAFEDLLQSTDDRIIVFYNFNAELDKLISICEDLSKPYSVVNGQHKDLTAYYDKSSSITLIQYQAGAMGLNLQLSNKIIYFTLPLGKGSCGLWEQSKKRIHRIGQTEPCFYYYLLCRDSIEMKNLAALKRGVDLTDELFRKEVRR
ncbi:MAG: DEAD/DEAH box helicase [Clostridiales Family XIII bacterium]|uniref:SNF2-related protein n=2 Tax=Bacteria TaxID=2 RepID=A0A9J6QW01_9FIRM|nr:DEAD/DEAH box helicase [Hominibacterium faecale]MCU7379743.1 SNF2-related protein [Hominibacterium faecale]MDY3011734.1 DEAD/DEAH box helicase [Clostridiales Family XIII bacterium]